MEFCFKDTSIFSLSSPQNLSDYETGLFHAKNVKIWSEAFLIRVWKEILQTSNLLNIVSERILAENFGKRRPVRGLAAFTKDFRRSYQWFAVVKKHGEYAHSGKIPLNLFAQRNYPYFVLLFYYTVYRIVKQIIWLFFY